MKSRIFIVALLVLGLWSSYLHAQMLNTIVFGSRIAAPGFSLVASTGGQSLDSNTVVSPAINTVGANLEIVAVAYYTGGSISFADSLLNTWTATTLYQSTGNTGIKLYCSYAPTTGAAQTFTITGTSGYPAIAIQAWSGAAASSCPPDKNNGHGSSSNVTSIQPGSITPSVNNELVVTAVALGGGTSYAVGSSYNITTNFNNSPGVAQGIGFAYLLQTTAAATNPQWSWTTATNGAATSASFK